MTDLGVLLESMSSVFNKSTSDNNSILNLNEDKTLKWRTLHNNQFACKKKGEGQTNSPSGITSETNSSCISTTSNNCGNGSGANDGNFIKACNSQKEDANIDAKKTQLSKNVDSLINNNSNMKSNQNKKQEDCFEYKIEKGKSGNLNSNKKCIDDDKNIEGEDSSNIDIKQEQLNPVVTSATFANQNLAINTVGITTKRTRSSEPSPSERCLRRSRPNETISSAGTINSNNSKSNNITNDMNSQQQQQQNQLQQRRRGRSKKNTTTSTEDNSINKNIIHEEPLSSVINDGPINGPKKSRKIVNKNDESIVEVDFESLLDNDIKKLDEQVKLPDKSNTNIKQNLQKHKTRRSTRLEVKLDNCEEINNDTKEFDDKEIVASVANEIKEENTDEKNFGLDEKLEKPSLQQITEKTPKKRGRRAKNQQQQQHQKLSPNTLQSNSSPQTSPLSTSANGSSFSTDINCSTTSITTANTTTTTTSLSKITNIKNFTKEHTSIPSLTSQRPLRRIKPTPKILENDELRYEFETKNIARITACTDIKTNEQELIKQTISNEVYNKKEARENSYLVAAMHPTSVITNSTGKTSSNSSVCSDRLTTNNSTIGVNDVKKKLFMKKNRNSIHESPIIYPALSDKKPCPDPEVFLNEIKAAKLNLNRSPEDKKLNRKQQRRLLKQKEKHLEKLGLRRNTKDEPTDSDISSGEDEFVPANSKKINVGKTNVTLRIRGTSSKENSKDSSQIIIPNSSNSNFKNVEEKYDIQNSLSISNSHQIQQEQLQQEQLQLEQSQQTINAINQALKQSLIRQSCSIPISTTGSVTITPIINNAATRQKRNQSLISQVNAGSEINLQTNNSNENVLHSKVNDSSPQKLLSTAISPNVGNKTLNTENLICLCQKPSHYYTKNIPGTAYCCAIDNIEEQKVGCCNQLSGELLNLLRPSERVGYMILCDDHLKRLRAHNCCANCGIFCTQGKFVLCQHKHFFHAECAQKFILNSPYDPSNTTNFTSPTLVLKCPHCGLDTPEKTSIVKMKCQTLPVFLPSQKTLNKPAKMSISDSQQSNHLRKKKLPVCVELENLIPESVMNVVVREANSSNNNSNGFTSRDMFYAVNNDDLERVAEILTSGYDITCEMTELLNGTCLHLVAHFGTVQMAYLLLCRESSSDFLNLVDKELRTALMCSIIGEKVDILKLLIQCGADVTLKGPDGMTCLHIAAKLGNIEAANLIVENHKNNASIAKFEKFINSQDDGGWTAIVWAAELGFTEIVSLLLNYGANPNICDAENNSVLHWATLSNHVDTVSVLLLSNVDCSIQNITGDTPLHIACRTSSTRVCLMLIANGADLMVKNKAGELPYDCIDSEDSQCARAVGFNMQMRSFGSTGLKNKIICSDISNGRESNPIQVIKRDRSSNDSNSSVTSNDVSNNNEVDDILLPDFKYITKSILLQSSIQIDQRISQMRICNCNDGCNSESCQCSSISIQNWYTPEGRLIGEFNFDDPAMIFECNDVCGCNKLSCKNRVVQNGFKTPLQIFECEERLKGWGVRTLINIPRGTFIAEYTGEILTDLEADRRIDDSYFFDLGVSEHCIDANYYGNLTRFFNHSCEPNIVPVRVYYEHQDYRFPKIAFFSSKDISSGDELCFDYGEKFWSVKQKYFPCKCLYPQCRYSKLLKTNATSNIAATTSSSSASSLLSSLSATSRIPAGTTITSITTTNNNHIISSITNNSSSSSNSSSLENKNYLTSTNSNVNKTCTINSRSNKPSVSIIL